MASSLSTRNQVPKPELTPLQAKIAELICAGTPHTEIARRIAKGDKAKASRYRSRIRRWAATDPAFQEAIGLQVKGQLGLALPVVTKALVKTATRGRVDAIKLVYEATGFHNPKIQHEHSGDIQIHLEVPRPAPVEDVVEGSVIQENILDAVTVDPGS